VPDFSVLPSLCALLRALSVHEGITIKKEAERYIVESERQWAESVASGDTTVVQRITSMM
jgi:hypothetical protein